MEGEGRGGREGMARVHMYIKTHTCKRRRRAPSSLKSNESSSDTSASVSASDSVEERSEPVV